MTVERLIKEYNILKPELIIEGDKLLKEQGFKETEKYPNFLVYESEIYQGSGIFILHEIEFKIRDGYVSLTSKVKGRDGYEDYGAYNCYEEIPSKMFKGIAMIAESLEYNYNNT